MPVAKWTNAAFSLSIHISAHSALTRELLQLRFARILLIRVADVLAKSLLSIPPGNREEVSHVSKGDRFEYRHRPHPLLSSEVQHRTFFALA
jgi:hypothetical protein